MKLSPLLSGLALQALALLVAWAAARRLYAAAWFVTLVFSVPLFVAGFALVLASGGPWPLRLFAAACLGLVPFVRCPRRDAR